MAGRRGCNCGIGELQFCVFKFRLPDADLRFGSFPLAFGGGVLGRGGCCRRPYRIEFGWRYDILAPEVFAPPEVCIEAVSACRGRMSSFPCGCNRSFRVFKRRCGNGFFNFVICRIEKNKGVPFCRLLIVPDQHLLHATGHPRDHRIDIALDLGVVGLFVQE